MPRVNTPFSLENARVPRVPRAPRPRGPRPRGRVALEVSKENAFSSAATSSAIHPIENPRFLGITRYKFKLTFWFNLNLYREIRISGSAGLRGGSISSGICHMWQYRICSNTTFSLDCMQQSRENVVQYGIQYGMDEAIRHSPRCVCSNTALSLECIQKYGILSNTA